MSLRARECNSFCIANHFLEFTEATLQTIRLQKLCWQNMYVVLLLHSTSLYSTACLYKLSIVYLIFACNRAVTTTVFVDDVDGE